MFICALIGGLTPLAAGAAEYEIGARPGWVSYEHIAIPDAPALELVNRGTVYLLFDRQIDVPARRVTSLCFGAGDGRDLYIVSADNTNDPVLGGTIFRTRAPAPGLATPLART